MKRLRAYHGTESGATDLKKRHIDVEAAQENDVVIPKELIKEKEKIEKAEKVEEVKEEK